MTHVPSIPAAVLAAVLCGCQPQAPTASGPNAEAIQFATKTGCFACHAIEKKFLGPPLMAVAAFYSADGEAEAKLMDKIAKGGDGVWGNIAMPGYPDMNEADRRMLAKFVLSLTN